MVKKLKIAATILLALLITIYLTFAVLSLLMLYSISFPWHGDGGAWSPESRKIGYAVLPIILIVSLVCSISSLLYLYKLNVNLILILPLYLFLPISIPYFLIQMKIKDYKEAYEINDGLFLVFFLAVTSLLNYLLTFFPLVLGIVALGAAISMPVILYYGIPLLVIALFMIIGTTANIINYYHQSKLANQISYIGFTFVWIYKFYKSSLIRNNLYSIKNTKIKVV